MTNFAPLFPPAPPPDHSWPDLTTAERKAWYVGRDGAFFSAWGAVVAVQKPTAVQ